MVWKAWKSERLSLTLKSRTLCVNLLLSNARYGVRGCHQHAYISGSFDISFTKSVIQEVFFFGWGVGEKIKRCRQGTDRSIQKMFALWCFPAWFSQASSAHLSCGERHTMLLCPNGLHHSSAPHNSSLWSQNSPGHSSQCLNTVPCWAPTHCHRLWSHSPRPRTASEAGEGTDSCRVSRTWKRSHT